MIKLGTFRSGLLALSLLTALMQVAPAVAGDNNATALTQDGIRAIADGRNEDAVKMLEQALQAAPNDASVRANLTMAYNNLALQQSKVDQALAMKTLRKSLNLNPNQTIARQNFDSMIRYFGRDPASFDDRVELAELARQDKDRQGQIYEYRAALAIKKDATVEERLKEALAPPKVFPVRPRPAASIQPNASAPVQPDVNAPAKPNNPASPVTPGAAKPAAPGAMPASAPGVVTPNAAPAVAPSIVPVVIPNTNSNSNSNIRPSANPN